MYSPKQCAARGRGPRCSPAFAGLSSLFTRLGPPDTVVPGTAGSKCYVFQLHGYAVFAQLWSLLRARKPESTDPNQLCTLFAGK